MEGFVELKTPSDLLEKLEHDYDIMVNQPGNTYAAFNFFVTAEHLPDWLHPGNKKEAKDARKAIRDNAPLLQVVSHIANSAKHFDKLLPHHESVAGTRKHSVINVAQGKTSGQIIIRLEKAKHQELIKDLGNTEIDCLDLAERVLGFWRDLYYNLVK